MATQVLQAKIGLVFRGDYSSTETYTANDMVRQGTKLYRCKVDSSVGNAPPTTAASNTQWEFAFNLDVGNGGDHVHFAETQTVALALSDIDVSDVVYVSILQGWYRSNFASQASGGFTSAQTGTGSTDQQFNAVYQRVTDLPTLLAGSAAGGQSVSSGQIIYAGDGSVYINNSTTAVAGVTAANLATVAPNSLTRLDTPGGQVVSTLANIQQAPIGALLYASAGVAITNGASTTTMPTRTVSMKISSTQLVIIQQAVQLTGEATAPVVAGYENGNLVTIPS